MVERKKPASGWSQTHDLWIKSHMLCSCATATAQLTVAIWLNGGEPEIIGLSKKPLNWIKRQTKTETTLEKKRWLSLTTNESLEKIKHRFEPRKNWFHANVVVGIVVGSGGGGGGGGGRMSEIKCLVWLGFNQQPILNVFLFLMKQWQVHSWEDFIRAT